MRIEIFDEGKRVIHLRFPTAVLLSRLGMGILTRIIAKTTASHADELDDELRSLTELAENPPEPPHIDKEALTQLAEELRRFKRRHPGFVLADIEDDSGDRVRITL